jgi:murein DD-endopeptidase MepM/ murein hydrolase activator NlpD
VSPRWKRDRGRMLLRPNLPAPIRVAAAVLLMTSLLGLSPAPGPQVPGPFVAEWSWPLRPAPDILRNFEKPPKPWQRGHRGVDLAIPSGNAGPGAVGTPILSPGDGVVSFAGTVVDRGVLSIDHGGGRVSSFEPVSTDLRKGQRVEEGDVVAALAVTAAATGPWHCASPCVHWGVRVDGEYVDPLSFVMDRRPSVLLPLEN